MNTRFHVITVYLVWIALGATSSAVLGACDSSSQVRDVVEDVCYQNSNPRLGNVFFLLGEPGNEVPIASPPSIKQGERAIVQLEYSDEECNLEDGILYFSIDEVSWQESASALRNLDGCSTVEEGDTIGFELPVETLGEGWHSLDIYGTDVCNDTSAVVTTQFRVLSGD
ncbi:MAG: hypothetical protein IT350_13965 [Deltaproteobacteria bacterium]|nr:hypothetical protein [Deltaproteobacteria bacterium]